MGVPPLLPPCHRSLQAMLSLRIGCWDDVFPWRRSDRGTDQQQHKLGSGVLFQLVRSLSTFRSNMDAIVKRHQRYIQITLAPLFPGILPRPFSPRFISQPSAREAKKAWVGGCHFLYPYPGFILIPSAKTIHRGASILWSPSGQHFVAAI